jgi:tRNA-specific 2-thiouridylase
MAVSQVNLIKYDTVPSGMQALTRIRYKDPGALSSLQLDNGSMRVRFYHPVKGIAPGQSAVFYEGTDVIGGGIIQRGELV